MSIKAARYRRDNSRVRGIIAVKDEAAQKTLSVLNSLETTRKDLAIDGIRVFFRILIWVSRDGSGFSDTEIIDSLASNQEEQDDEQEKTTPEADGEV